MMNKLALNIPGSGSIQSPYPQINNLTLGSIISLFLPTVLYIAGFMMLFWTFWGVFQYIFAGGEKGALSQARQRITWAIIGFFLVMLAFAISSYTESIFPQRLPKGIQTITIPPEIP